MGEGGTPTLTLILFEGGAAGVVVPGATVPVSSEGEGGAAVVADAVGLTTVAGIVGSSGADVGEGVTDSTDEGLGTSELDVSSMAESVGFGGSSGLRVVRPWEGRAVDTVGISMLDVSLTTEPVGFEGFPGPRRVVTTSVEVVGTATDVDEDSNTLVNTLVDEVAAVLWVGVAAGADSVENDGRGSVGKTTVELSGMLVVEVNSCEDVNEGRGSPDEVLSGISFIVVGPASEEELGSGASVVRVDSAAVARWGRFFRHASGSAFLKFARLTLWLFDIT